MSYDTVKLIVTFFIPPFWMEIVLSYKTNFISLINFLLLWTLLKEKNLITILSLSLFLGYFFKIWNFSCELFKSGL